MSVSTVSIQAMADSSSWVLHIRSKGKIKERKDVV